MGFFKDITKTLAAPLVGLAGSLFGSNQRRKGANAQAKAAREINAKTLAFQNEMWRKTNAYNTPKNQMKRFLAAGLNPNLIYGRGQSGNAGMLSTPDLNVPDDAAAYNATADIPKNFLNFAQVAASSALTQSRRQNVEQDTANKAIESTIKATKAASDKLSYKAQEATYNTVVDTAKKNLARINQDIELRRNKDNREERIVSKTVKKLSQEIENLRTKGKILSEEEIIKRIDRIMYQDYKLRPNDPYYMRIFSDIYDVMMEQGKKYIGKPTSKYQFKY